MADKASLTKWFHAPREMLSLLSLTLARYSSAMSPVPMVKRTTSTQGDNMAF